MSDFLGSGWQLPLRFDLLGRVEMTRGEASVRQAIWTILSTAKGERVMRPDFGCGIHDLVFAPNSASTHGLIAGAVEEALVLWEPRIDLINVAASADPSDAAKVFIDIDYRLRATNSRFNLVYPFYLE